jgi:cyclin D1/2/4
MLQLLSVACMSLAAKMEETEVPILLDLQVESCTVCRFIARGFVFLWADYDAVWLWWLVWVLLLYWENDAECRSSVIWWKIQVEDVEHIFEAHTIQRMELLVLSTLDWRMSSVTPFSYIDYYFHKLGISNVLLRALLSRVSEIILATLRGAYFCYRNL